ncbi:MAG TPA: glycosyltransferase [Stellaceae bacterium]|nr:glycosyltransferase [Stellaceae bacterium]
MTEAAPAPPRAAIVIPLYEHSGLVAGALDSALSQEAGFGIVTIVVNDGCPSEESHAVATSFAAAYPAHVRYVLKANGGLSSARNAGVEYGLAQFPSVEAFYFLDADNLLRRRAIAHAYECMTRENADWVYPNIDMFGLDWFSDYGGEYSRLLHTAHNICEAGSLVRRRVFEAGIRFDETMRSGFEDWDFWLSAGEHGFRGVNEEFFGFLYRKRPESMLAESERVRPGLISYLEGKHKRLYAVPGLIELEQAEAPRYAIVDFARGAVSLTSDPAVPGRVVSLDEFAVITWQHLAEPARRYFPMHVVFTDGVQLEALREAKLLHWTFWDLERWGAGSIYALAFEEEPLGGPELAISRRDELVEAPVLFALTASLFLNIVHDPAREWIESILGDSPQPRFVSRIVRRRAPQPARLVDLGRRVVHTFDEIRERFSREVLERSWKWRTPGPVNRSDLAQLARARFDGAPAYPRLAGGDRFDIGFVMPIAEFGGVERTAYCLAAELAAAGHRCHLFVTERGETMLPAEFRAIFDTINFLDDDTAGMWSQSQVFEGTHLPDWYARGNRLKNANAALGLLAWLDVAIGCHSGSLDIVASRLRTLGVATATWLHVHDRTPFGKPKGHTVLALAFEHGFDRVLCCSEQMRLWGLAQGIPASKLLLVPNAPGYALAPETAQAIMAARRGRSGKLRVLYLGRLDAQKGVDRLASLVEMSTESETVEWRIVGKAIMERDHAVPRSIAAVLEPPVLDPPGLTELYGWADIVVLLSDYEGLPLTLLEAMRCGCVPIATRVGAVDEAIEHGRTGLLVDRSSAAAEAWAALRRFAARREELLAMAEAAHLAAMARSWREVAERLCGSFESIVRRRRDRRSQSNDTPPPSADNRFSIASS